MSKAIELLNLLFSSGNGVGNHPARNVENAREKPPTDFDIVSVFRDMAERPKLYIGGITQSGVSAPAADDAVLNEIGELTFAYVGVGSYTATKTGAFVGAVPPFAYEYIIDDQTNLKNETTKYIAALTQAGTAAPTAATPLINNIGEIVFTYSGVGVYIGTLAAAFTNKIKPFSTFVILAGPVIGYVTVEYTSANTVTIRTYDAALAPANGILNSTQVSIEALSKVGLVFEKIVVEKLTDNAVSIKHYNSFNALANTFSHIPIVIEAYPIPEVDPDEE